MKIFLRIKIGSRIEEVRIFVFGEIDTQEYVSQSNGACEEADRVKLSSYKWNTKRIGMIRSCGRSKTAFSCNGLIVLLIDATPDILVQRIQNQENYEVRYLV